MLKNWKQKLKNPKFLISFIAFKIGSKVLILWIMSLFMSCNNQATSPSSPQLETSDTLNTEKPNNPPPQIIKSSASHILLTISAKQAIVRAEPDPTAPELDRFSEGSSLDYLGEVTAYTTLIRIQGIDHEEPWLKVQMPNGSIGWIYGGAVSFNGLSDQKLSEMVFDKRLKKTFGEEIASSIKIYQKELADCQTTAAFRMLYKRGSQLSNKLEQQLNEGLQLATADSLPDFFWLNESLPGFLVHLIDSAKSYQLYRDFSYWAALSKATAEDEDDLLIAPFLIAYQTDSIEYNQPDWRLALSPDESYSLLGRGMHKATLDALQIAFDATDGFEEELGALKNKLLDDISLSKDFWEDQQSVLEELEAIIIAKYQILRKADLVELTARQKMLKTPSKYNLRTNLFEGGE